MHERNAAEIVADALTHVARTEETITDYLNAAVPLLAVHELVTNSTVNAGLIALCKDRKSREEVEREFVQSIMRAKELEE